MCHRNFWCHVVLQFSSGKKSIRLHKRDYSNHRGYTGGGHLLFAAAFPSGTSKKKENIIKSILSDRR